MKRELVDDIYKRLLNEDWKGLPPYLKGGQMGMCMFMALYSEYRNCGKARSLSARILPEVIKFIQYMPNRLLDGKTTYRKKNIYSPLAFTGHSYSSKKIRSKDIS